MFFHSETNPVQIERQLQLTTEDYENKPLPATSKSLIFIYHVS